MLILSRKKGEAIVVQIGGEMLTVVVTDLNKDRVKLGFEAPPSVRIVREEVLDREKAGGG